MYTAPRRKKSGEIVLKVSVQTDVQRALLQAAAACILRDGIEKISVEDVAAEAKVSRRTVYRAFQSKEHLLAALFEWHTLGVTFDKALRHVGGLDFEEAFLEGTLAGIRAIQRDRLTREMMYGAGGHWYQKQMLDVSSPLSRAVRRIQMRFWRDILDRAREKGLLNPALSNDQIIEWYTMAQYFLVVRANHAEADRRFVVRNLLIPAFLKRPNQG
ncbi:MAG: TetR/AcrR family transcriptional regulator [Steroidobacteraceae bacterium]